MKINRRKANILVLVGILIAGLFYYLLIVSPAISRQRALEKYIRKKEADITKMLELNSKWERYKKNKVKAEKTLVRRGKKFTLLSFMEGISRRIGIHNSIEYIKPISSLEESRLLKQVGMEIKLGDINIKQLVNFLYEIEYSDKLLRIKRIIIKRLSKDKARSLQVTLQVNTYNAI